MKKTHIGALVAATIFTTTGAMAQSAIDAMQLTQGDFLNGTARYQAMGGAFTALGGDLSSLGQNPAGIGVYRQSEVGLTFSADMQSAKTETHSNTNTTDQTKWNFDNIAYVGSTRLDNDIMNHFAWGVGYNRRVSFNRIFNGSNYPISNSLTNYIAAFSQGYTPDQLLDKDGYNPYYDSNCDWLSILAYNSYMINPNGASSYQGLYGQGTDADAMYQVQEEGYVDEYNIDFGGNLMNTVYWGLGLGITDMSYTRRVWYSESMQDAYIPDRNATGTTLGSAEYDLNNYKYIDGTGVNVKFGLIYRPVNEFRIGLAIHTPTWYALTTSYDANTFYNYTPNQGTWAYKDGQQYTDYANYDWRLTSPWRLMVGAAGVLMNRVIISADYEMQAYQNMSMRVPYYDNQGYQLGYESDDATNDEIKNYCQSRNIIRLGAEVRALPWLSLRLGYNWIGSNASQEVRDGKYEVYTSGTDPSFSFDQTTQLITAGVGLRYKAFYLDMAYVHKNREDQFHAYTNYDGLEAPRAKVTNNDNKLVFSLGFKF